MFKSGFLEMRSFDRFSRSGYFFSNDLVESSKICITTVLFRMALKKPIGFGDTLVLSNDGFISLPVSLTYFRSLLRFSKSTVVVLESGLIVVRSLKNSAGEGLSHDWLGLGNVWSNEDGFSRHGWMESMDSMTFYRSDIEIHFSCSPIDDGYRIKNLVGYARKMFDTCPDPKQIFGVVLLHKIWSYYVDGDGFSYWETSLWYETQNRGSHFILGLLDDVEMFEGLTEKIMDALLEIQGEGTSGVFQQLVANDLLGTAVMIIRVTRRQCVSDGVDLDCIKAYHLFEDMSIRDGKFGELVFQGNQIWNMLGKFLYDIMLKKSDVKETMLQTLRRVGICYGLHRYVFMFQTGGNLLVVCWGCMIQSGWLDEFMLLGALNHLDWMSIYHASAHTNGYGNLDCLAITQVIKPELVDPVQWMSAIPDSVMRSGNLIMFSGIGLITSIFMAAILCRGFDFGCHAICIKGWGVVANNHVTVS